MTMLQRTLVVLLTVVLSLVTCKSSLAPLLLGSSISYLPEERVDKHNTHSIRHRSTSSLQCSGDINITSQADVDSGPIASCTSISGDLIFDNASGNITFPVGTDSQLETIDGSIYCRNNTSLENLNLYGITSISGSIVVQHAASLVSIAAQGLEYVQAIELTNVPQFLAFEFSLVTWMESIEIGQSPMTGENLKEGLARLQSVGTLYIHNCLNIDLALQALHNITEHLVVEDNGPDTDVVLPIQWANNVTLRNINGLTLDHLVAVNGSMEISNNHNLTSAEIGSLESIGASLYIENNPSLTIVAINSLRSIGGSFVETNNSVLENPGVFPSLQNVGLMELAGPFSSL